MKITHKLSRQGIVKVDAITAEELKTNFADEVIVKNGLVTKGYFIGKTLLAKMLFENEDAAGIMVNFGMNKPIARGGQIQLVIESASGISKDDVPVVMRSLQKYATTAETGDGGPDGLLPMIKPTPPHS
jgi:hypothetical protein